MNFETFKKELLKNDKFKKEYYRKDDIAFDISEMIVSARIKKGMTQKELARKIGTKQSSIARLESGNFLPSIKFLQKIAKAFDTILLPPKLDLLENKNTETMLFENKIEDDKDNILILDTPSSFDFNKSKNNYDEKYLVGNCQ
ncbi:helix-turn-helix transcriptional regulator [Candidatus Parcubacteria bacterium]|nr:helix-turn-helix transcriptional regulator [Candidatus Parcubacteria bacterium]